MRCKKRRKLNEHFHWNNEMKNFPQNCTDWWFIFLLHVSWSISNKLFPTLLLSFSSPMINEPLLNILKVFHSLWFFVFKFFCTRTFSPRLPQKKCYKFSLCYDGSPCCFLLCERQDSFSISQHDLYFSFRKLKTSSSDEFWKFCCSFDFEVTFFSTGLVKR